MVLRKIRIEPGIQIGGEINHSGPCDPTSFTGCLKPKNVLDCQKLSALLGIKDSDQLTEYHRIWAEDVLKSGSSQRDAKWMQSIAVGETKAKLGAKAIGRRKMKNIEGYEL